MFEELLKKALSSHSWLGGMALSLPAWIFSSQLTIHHGEAMGALIIIMVIDWITGSALAKKSNKVRLTSNEGISSLNRDLVMILLPVLGTIIDHILGSKSYVFAFFVGSLIWQNGYSVLGNIIVLKWQDHIPAKLYLMIYKIIGDEVKEKFEKYFKGENNEKTK